MRNNFKKSAWQADFSFSGKTEREDSEEENL